MWNYILWNTKTSRRYLAILWRDYVRINPLLRGEGLELMKEFGIFLFSAVVWWFLAYFVFLDDLMYELREVDFAKIRKEARHVLSITLFSIFLLGVYSKVYETLTRKLALIIPDLIDWFWDEGVYYIIYIVDVVIHTTKLCYFDIVKRCFFIIKFKLVPLLCIALESIAKLIEKLLMKIIMKFFKIKIKLFRKMHNAENSRVGFILLYIYIKT